MKQEITSALHPSPVELTEFALGSLNEVRAAIIEAHVYGCDRCGQVVSQAPRDDFLTQLQDSRISSSDKDLLDSPVVPASGHGVAGLTDLPEELRKHSRFAVKRLIAEGAMGRVYLAQVRDNGQYVAVKLMRPDIASNPRMVDRFLQEARVAGQLRHPNIASVMGYESLSGAAVIVMEFVRGRTLAQIVRRRGPLPVDEACEYIRQAANGLAHAARLGIVHRDIKPHNFMFDPSTGLLKIVDFGLGRLLDEQRTGSRLTRDDEILGTLDYISPEQAANSRDADLRSDIYSLGCTFYFLLTGSPPFSGKNAVELLRKHERERPTAIRSLRPEVSADVANLLDRMMQKDAQARPQSPQEILKVLGHSHSASASNPPTQRKSSTNLGSVQSGAPTLLSRFASPAVLLPAMTCLICIVWLLLRK